MTGASCTTTHRPVLRTDATMVARSSGDSEQCFYQLEAPVLRVGGFSTPYPPSRLEEHYLPDLDRVLDAVDRTFAY